MQFVSIEKKKNYALLHLDRGKVNAINHQMVRDIREAVAGLAGDQEVRGVIICGKPGFFSAGLDLIELYQYGLEEIRAFWTDFMGMMIDLIKFPKPMMAAITGHSPAGGAVIAITCDYRYMAAGDRYQIGLNEVAVGINITDGIFESYSFWLGRRQAYQALLKGRLFTVDEALEVGLIDGVYPADTLVEAVEQEMQQVLSAHDFILRSTKQIMRDQWIRLVDRDMTEEIEKRSAYWMHPDSQRAIGAMVARLTGHKPD